MSQRTVRPDPDAAPTTPTAPAHVRAPRRHHHPVHVLSHVVAVRGALPSGEGASRRLWRCLCARSC